MLYPVILCGGGGARLWPKSRRAMPKPFLALTSERSLLQETVFLLSGIEGVAPPTLVCDREHRFLAAEQLREIETPVQTLLLEPVLRNTAPALATAAMCIAAQDEGALMLVLPADCMIRDAPAFRIAIAKATTAAQCGYLATFGVAPHRAETGYGYIRRGDPIANAPDVYQVAQFVEKPDTRTAQSYLEAGDYLWNSGMFLMSARQYLDELERFEPEMVKACRVAVESARRDLDFLHLDETAFCQSPSLSIDCAVMEKTDKAAVVPVDMGWSDLGSWDALWEQAEKDEDGNARRGDICAHDTRDCYIHAEARLVATVGVENLIIVETADAVLVAQRGHSQDVRKIVEELQREGRGD